MIWDNFWMKNVSWLLSFSLNVDEKLWLICTQVVVSHCKHLMHTFSNNTISASLFVVLLHSKRMARCCALSYNAVKKNCLEYTTNFFWDTFLLWYFKHDLPHHFTNIYTTMIVDEIVVIFFCHCSSYFFIYCFYLSSPYFPNIFPLSLLFLCAVH